MGVTPGVLSEENFREGMAAISAQLDACRKDGTFAGFDGKTLYYESFRKRESRGAVVIVHGLSEFTRKYHEFAWYLLQQGYDVFLYDHRCHGRSCRLTDRQDLIHVDRFSHYAKDLHCFVCEVVKKTTDLPLYVYGHSMGGAVTAQYLAQHPEVFQKAVMAAPMIQPLTGNVSPFVARWGLTAWLLFGNGKKKFWYSGEYDPDFPFSRSRDTSFARFTHNKQIRLENPCYCTTPQTVRWVQQSLVLRRRLTRKGFLKKIQTPVLMICAEDDGMVNPVPQNEFARKCAACRQVVIPGTTHSMLCGSREIIAQHIQLVADHFV